MTALARRRRRDVNHWPGFVDALATLLMVIIFALMVFIISQFYLTHALTGRDEALERLTRQISELSDLLSLERETSAELRLNVAQLSAELQNSIVARDSLSAQVTQLLDQRDSLESRLAQVTGERAQLMTELNHLRRERESLDTRLGGVLSEREALIAKLRLAEEEAELRTMNVEELRRELEAARREQAASAEAVSRMAEELEATRADLARRGDDLSRRSAALAEAQKEVEASRDTIKLQLADLERLRRDIAALEEVKTQLEERVVELAAALKLRDNVEIRLKDEAAEARTRVEDLRATLAERQRRVAELAALLTSRDQRAAKLEETAEERRRRIDELTAQLTAARDRTKQLEARLSTQEERTALAQTELDKRDVRLAELLSQLGDVRSNLDKERRISEEARRQVEVLNQQVLALRQELARIATLLEASEAVTKEQRAQILDLGARLNQALASKVQELARYRSEFFGRLREVLSDRQNIRIVGDRFVFQSEVLFETGSADIGLPGELQLTQLADTLKEIAKQIPQDIDWVLRIDGHTDSVPISTPQFPSNWELSAARAIEVVKYLIAQGVPPHRLAAAGFGEFQPLDPRGDEVARRRNRRIEMKLDQR